MRSIEGFNYASDGPGPSITQGTLRFQVAEGKAAIKESQIPVIFQTKFDCRALSLRSRRRDRRRE